MQRMVLSLKKLLGLNNIFPEYDLSTKIEFVGRTAHCDTFLKEADNVDITDEFHVRRRDGFDQKVIGNIHSLWSNDNICLYREGSYLKQLYSNYTSVTLRSNLTTLSAPMSYLSLVDKIYYMDGIDTGIIENGVSRSWGLDYPIHPNITRIDGVMREGNYKIALVYVRENGMISGTEVPIMANMVVNSALTLSNIISSSDSTVKYIDIYMTFPNGDALYFLDRINNGTTTYTINTNNVKSGLPLQVVGLSKPPTGQILEYYNGRIYVVKDNVAWYSEPFMYELFRLRTNYIMFESAFTLFAAVDDGIWVSDGNKIIFSKGNNPPFKFEEKAEYGAIRGTQKIISGDYIGEGKGEKFAVWSSPDGICIGGNGGSFKNITNKHFSFPTANEGISLFKRKRGINQLIVSLKNAGNPENIYE